jgi:hypothetical protein
MSYQSSKVLATGMNQVQNYIWGQQGYAPLLGDNWFFRITFSFGFASTLNAGFKLLAGILKILITLGRIWFLFYNLKKG